MDPQTPEIQPSAQEAAPRALCETNVRHPIVGNVESIDCILVQRVWRWQFIGVLIDWRKKATGFGQSACVHVAQSSLLL